MARKTCVLGLDIGTTSTIGILIEVTGKILGMASRPVTLNAPHPGWAEEDPKEWWGNVCGIADELLRTSGMNAQSIAAIGVTGMLPAVVLLDCEGAVLRPSIQQSDGRCGKQATDLRAEWDEKSFIAKAGNGINQQLVGAKLRWIEEHEFETSAFGARHERQRVDLLDPQGRCVQAVGCFAQSLDLPRIALQQQHLGCAA